MAAENLAEADQLYNKGDMENYKQAIALYLKALEQNPNDYETNWKCARAYRAYGNEAKKQNVEDWKDICAKYGKEGMKYAQQAIDQDPNKPHGYFYYGLNVGIYSDGVSILTAYAEGLKNKTQTSFEKTYELDKMYDDAGPILALGRFWAVLPWPFHDKKKALKYYREYQATKYFEEKDEGKIYLSELLIKLGGDKNKEEAKVLLEKVSQSDDKYFSDWAKRLLEKMKE
jgi:hypothetical protein